MSTTTDSLECDRGDHTNYCENVRVFNFNDDTFIFYQSYINEDEPILLKNCSFGSCMAKWDLDYLKSKIGEEKVVIHDSNETSLNFLEKNFKYKTCSFTEFADKINDSNKNVYLRSTNKNPRSKQPARIEDDFPNLREDLDLPEFVPYGTKEELYHSSVLRVASSSIQIWTHYDIYDNVLCQVKGVKRVILFPPNDIEHLHIKDDKSMINNFDNWQECLEQYPSLKRTSPLRCLLKPGDALFIPAFWWHNIKTVEGTNGETASHSIGFNIFWKNQLLEERSMYQKDDVYGNKNLNVVDFAITFMDKAAEKVNRLPEKYQIFYKHYLLEKFKSKLFQKPARNSTR